MYKYAVHIKKGSIWHDVKIFSGGSSCYFQWFFSGSIHNLIAYTKKVNAQVIEMNTHEV